MALTCAVALAEGNCTSKVVKCLHLYLTGPNLVCVSSILQLRVSIVTDVIMPGDDQRLQDLVSPKASHQGRALTYSVSVIFC